MATQIQGGVAGINQLISNVVAEDDNSIVTNSGVTVYGLEAAAYVFGQVLSNYPEAAHTLDRTSQIFSMPDGQGGTTMISLNELSDIIHSKYGYDPLVEFSAGVGTSSYSLADIQFVLRGIMERYDTMDFPLAQTGVGTSNEVGNAGGLSIQTATALSQLKAYLTNTLSASSFANGAAIDYSSAIFRNSPGGTPISFNEVLNRIKASTGVNLRDVLSDTFSNSTQLTGQIANDIYAFFNKHKAAGVANLALLDTTRTVSAANIAQLDDELLNIHVSNVVLNQSLLALGGYLAQLSHTHFENDTDSLNLDAAIFNVPDIAQRAGLPAGASVSLNQILHDTLMQHNIDLKELLPDIFIPGAASINYQKVQDLETVLNQSVGTSLTPGNLTPLYLRGTTTTVALPDGTSRALTMDELAVYRFRQFLTGIPESQWDAHIDGVGYLNSLTPSNLLNAEDPYNPGHQISLPNLLIKIRNETGINPENLILGENLPPNAEIDLTYADLSVYIHAVNAYLGLDPQLGLQGLQLSVPALNNQELGDPNTPLSDNDNQNLDSEFQVLLNGQINAANIVGVTQEQIDTVRNWLANLSTDLAAATLPSNYVSNGVTYTYAPAYFELNDLLSGSTAQRVNAKAQSFASGAAQSATPNLTSALSAATSAGLIEQLDLDPANPADVLEAKRILNTIAPGLISNDGKVTLSQVNGVQTQLNNLANLGALDNPGIFLDNLAAFANSFAGVASTPAGAIKTSLLSHLNLSGSDSANIVTALTALAAISPAFANKVAAGQSITAADITALQASLAAKRPSFIASPQAAFLTAIAPQSQPALYLTQPATYIDNLVAFLTSARAAITSNTPTPANGLTVNSVVIRANDLLSGTSPDVQITTTTNGVSGTQNAATYYGDQGRQLFGNLFTGSGLNFNSDQDKETLLNTLGVLSPDLAAKIRRNVDITANDLTNALTQISNNKSAFISSPTGAIQGSVFPATASFAAALKALGAYIQANSTNTVNGVKQASISDLQSGANGITSAWTQIFAGLGYPSDLAGAASALQRDLARYTPNLSSQFNLANGSLSQANINSAELNEIRYELQAQNPSYYAQQFAAGLAAIKADIAAGTFNANGLVNGTSGPATFESANTGWVTKYFPNLGYGTSLANGKALAKDDFYQDLALYCPNFFAAYNSTYGGDGVISAAKLADAITEVNSLISSHNAQSYTQNIGVTGLSGFSSSQITAAVAALRSLSNSLVASDNTFTLPSGGATALTSPFINPSEIIAGGTVHIHKKFTWLTYDSPAFPQAATERSGDLDSSVTLNLNSLFSALGLNSAVQADRQRLADLWNVFGSTQNGYYSAGKVYQNDLSVAATNLETALSNHDSLINNLNTYRQTLVNKQNSAFKSQASSLNLANLYFAKDVGFIKKYLQNAIDSWPATPSSLNYHGTSYNISGQNFVISSLFWSRDQVPVDVNIPNVNTAAATGSFIPGNLYAQLGLDPENTQDQATFNQIIGQLFPSISGNYFLTKSDIQSALNNLDLNASNITATSAQLINSESILRANNSPSYLTILATRQIVADNRLDFQAQIDQLQALQAPLIRSANAQSTIAYLQNLLAAQPQTSYTPSADVFYLSTLLYGDNKPTSWPDWSRGANDRWLVQQQYGQFLGNSAHSVTGASGLYGLLGLTVDNNAPFYANPSGGQQAFAIPSALQALGLPAYTDYNPTRTQIQGWISTIQTYLQNHPAPTNAATIVSTINTLIANATTQRDALDAADGANPTGVNLGAVQANLTNATYSDVLKQVEHIKTQLAADRAAYDAAIGSDKSAKLLILNARQAQLDAANARLKTVLASDMDTEIISGGDAYLYQYADRIKQFVVHAGDVLNYGTSRINIGGTLRSLKDIDADLKRNFGISFIADLVGDSISDSTPISKEQLEGLVNGIETFSMSGGMNMHFLGLGYDIAPSSFLGSATNQTELVSQIGAIYARGAIPQPDNVGMGLVNGRPVVLAGDQLAANRLQYWLASTNIASFLTNPASDGSAPLFSGTPGASVLLGDDPYNPGTQISLADLLTKIRAEPARGEIASHASQQVSRFKELIQEARSAWPTTEPTPRKWMEELGFDPSVAADVAAFKELVNTVAPSLNVNSWGLTNIASADVSLSNSINMNGLTAAINGYDARGATYINSHNQIPGDDPVILATLGVNWREQNLSITQITQLSAALDPVVGHGSKTPDMMLTALDPSGQRFYGTKAAVALLEQGLQDILVSGGGAGGKVGWREEYVSNGHKLSLAGLDELAHKLGLGSLLSMLMRPDGTPIPEKGGVGLQEIDNLLKGLQIYNGATFTLAKEDGFGAYRTSEELQAAINASLANANMAEASRTNPDGNPYTINMNWMLCASDPARYDFTFHNLEDQTDFETVKATLESFQFVDVSSQQAPSAVRAAASAAPNIVNEAPLSTTEIKQQISGGDLYIDSHGVFYLNRQRTNARDLVLASRLVAGDRLEDQLTGLMNNINNRNIDIQIAKELQSATNEADFRSKLTDLKAKYGVDDVLSRITGGSQTDANYGDYSRISGVLQGVIDVKTKDAELDQQNLQNLNNQIEANNTAMTTLLKSFEELMKGLIQALH